MDKIIIIIIIFKKLFYLNAINRYQKARTFKIDSRYILNAIWRSTSKWKTRNLIPTN